MTQIALALSFLSIPAIIVGAHDGKPWLAFGGLVGFFGSLLYILVVR